VQNVPFVGVYCGTKLPEAHNTVSNKGPSTELEI
jgi:hypothetical protein